MTSGLLLIDKEPDWTSHDAVARTRRLAGTRKVGHAGTLDPMATGLLILGVKSSTRLLTYIVGQDKEYRATIRLGSSTTTDDAQGDEQDRASAASVAQLTAAQVGEAMADLTGDIDQRPSAVSAIKVDGKRAYARVRAGEDVQLASRPVTVSTFELLGDQHIDGFLDLDVRVECSSGTYIRALARDLGAALGVGGHLTSLRRTRVGPFDVADAVGLGDLDVAARLISPADAAVRLFPRLDLTDEQAIDLGHGKRVEVSDTQLLEPAPDGPVAAIAPGHRLVGLVELRGSQARTLVNFPTDSPTDSPTDAAANTTGAEA